MVLRSVGLSGWTARNLHDMNEVLYGNVATKNLSIPERCDLRYLQEMMEHNSLPFIHPFYKRHEDNSKISESMTTTEYQSEHSCVICDCGTPTQLANLLK